MFNFWHKLKIENEYLKKELENLKEFHLQKKEDTITDLTNRNKKLEQRIEELLNSKELAKQELEKEFKDFKSKLQDEYSLRVMDLEKSFDEKLKNKVLSIEEANAREIENRVNTAVWDIRITNKELTRELEQKEKWLTMYKDKFEKGKVELWADEIKWMLLSANPNWMEILKQLKWA